MSRVYLVTLILAVLFASSIIMMRLIGNGHPTPAAVLFTDPNGLSCDRPCLFGIRPGATKMDDIVGLLRSHPLIRTIKVTSQKPFRVVIVDQPEISLIVAATPEGIVDAIYLSTGPRMGHSTDYALGFIAQHVAIGDFVSLWGNPNGVIYQGIGPDTMAYVFHWVGISVPQSKTNADHL